MAGSQLVLTDDSAFSKVERALYRIETWLALLSGIAVFSLMIMAVISVAGRNFFASPLPGYIDWIEQAMPLIAFMGISYTQRDGGHIRMDILVGALRGRALHLAEFITAFAMLILMVLLVWGTFAHFQRSFDFAAPWWSRDSSMDIAIPLWPAKLLAPIAFAVICLRLLLQLYAYARAIVVGDPQPVGVPMVADAATQAAMEAEHVSSSNDGAV